MPEMTPARPVGDMTPAERDALFERLRRAITAALPTAAEVDVSPWAGCDEEQVAFPVYVTAEDADEEREYFDAVGDAEQGFDELVADLVEQLVDG